MPIGQRRAGPGFSLHPAYTGIIIVGKIRSYSAKCFVKQRKLSGYRNAGNNTSSWPEGLRQDYGTIFLDQNRSSVASL